MYAYCSIHNRAHYMVLTQIHICYKHVRRLRITLNLIITCRPTDVQKNRISQRRSTLQQYTTLVIQKHRY